MNREQYNGDPRYAKVLEQMDLLQIMDITTTRQHKNGTIVWRLPIKNHNNRNPSYIEVASFSTGYVRNQNSGYSNYQLNKRCEGEPEYFKCTNKHDGSDLYRKFTTKACVLIPKEIDRLEHLIAYCLKNYYIKRANEVINGSYVSKWYHEYEVERAFMAKKVDVIEDLQEKLDAMADANEILSDEIDFLKNKLSNAVSPTKYECLLQNSLDLENRLKTIKRISDYDTK